MIEVLLTETRGHSAVSILQTPSEGNNDCLIIFCHGFVGHKITPHRMFPELCLKLNKLGFSTLRTDCIGSGDSEGEKEFMTIPGQVEDYVNVYKKWIKDRNYKKIILLGYSMGGTTASLLSKEVKNDGMVLWSPVFDPYWNFCHLLGSEKFKKGLDGFDVDIEGDYVGKEFFKGIENIKVIPIIKDYSKPIRVVHGSLDEDVLPINGWSYIHFAKNGKISFVEGADHTYADIKFKEELFDNTIKYLKEIIKEV